MDFGLALGAGGARGLAHAGLLRGLSRAGARPGRVAGSSIGALVGAVFCGGDLEGFCRWAASLSRLEALRLADPVFPRAGLLEGGRLMEALGGFLRVRRLEDCSPSLAVVAVRARDGAPLVLTRGPLLDAVRASIAVPGVLTPGLWDGQPMLDGALAEPLPVGPCRRLGPGAVVAVDVSRDLLEPQEERGGDASPLAGFLKDNAARLLSSLGPRLGGGGVVAAELLGRWLEEDAADPLPNIVETIIGALGIAQRTIKAERLRAEPPEHVLAPAVGHIRFLDFHRGAEALEAGERAALDLLNVLPR
ncbi:patatin-like phospholipase family protein [Desulfovibrio aminophilus]|nr:patatin-like phospholipase family protein [Desulfovibrio aminophilus]MCM0755747.1 patatin-like phospholipase family protein [Desulfovibrio aminophilus]